MIATFALVVGAMFLVDVVPPRSQTDCAMHMSRRRILRYAAKHNALPAKISETEEIAGYDKSIKDAWGHDLIYTIATNGDVTVMSLGKDNRLGGSNDDADMVGVFPSKKPDGSWSEELVEWKFDPFEQFRKTSEPNHTSEGIVAKSAKPSK